MSTLLIDVNRWEFKLKRTVPFKSHVVLVVLLIFVLTGCNTNRGVGQDIEKAGQGIQKSTK